MSNSNKELFELKQVSIRLVNGVSLYAEKPINGPQAAIEILGKEISQFDREVICVVNLQSDGKPINFEITSVGALDYSLTSPRELLKSAILSNASKMLLLHLHPSGNLQPSGDDIRLTAKMIRLCHDIGIPLIDHIIIGGRTGEFFSFREKNLMEVDKIKYPTDLEKLNFAERKNYKTRDMEIEL